MERSKEINNTKIIFACSGLGHIQRGAESHIRGCFDILKDNKVFDFYLLKGGGSSFNNEKKIFCIKRNNIFLINLANLLKINKIQIEHFSFFLFSLPCIIKIKPRIIYSPNYFLSRYYFVFRNLFRLNFKIILIQSGSELNKIDKIEYVHQLLNVNKNKLISQGIKSEDQFVIPHGFNSENFREVKNIADIKNKYGLPSNRTIIMSIGIVNSTEKRYDYLLRELSRLKLNDFFFVGVGEFDNESKQIFKLADNLLGYGNYKFLTVNHHQMPELYSCANLICQPSINEGFGKVYVESMLAKRTLICHDFAISREVVGEFAILRDLTKDGELTSAIDNIFLNRTILSNIEKSKEYAECKYDWKIVKNDYINMFSYFIRRRND